jgi:broad specificity phosphatase PhoE
MCLEVPRSIPADAAATVATLAATLRAVPAAVATKAHATPLLGADDSPVKKRVFFLRHGQAVHNIVEDQVKMRVAKEAQAMGHAKGSEAVELLIKQARFEALSDETLRDAALSELGRQQLLATQAKMDGSDHSLPTAVLVSPLLRTLQSAAIVFPSHSSIHVCPLLRERNTGMPCDLPSQQSLKRVKFPNVDFTADMLPHQSSVSRDNEVEDASALRLRTAGLAEVLRNLKDQNVAVVSHKGFLRELERGPLGRSQATEFKPAELRVLDVTIWSDGSMDAEECEDIFQAESTCSSS